MVQRRLGAGNFATVYLAHDERLAVPVAVKLLSDRWSWEPEVRGRFVQEARLLRSLNDPHVVQIRDIAETDDGRPYLVMDFATEGTLEQRSAEMAQRQVRPTVEDLRVAARSLAAALSVLHERRIAHRDIKPSNLLITRAGPGGLVAPVPGEAASSAIVRPGERLMLGDLGLAKDLSFDSGITVGVGTAGYMAPEQTLPGAKIDMRTDIYAASALMAQLASGEAPDPVRRVSNGKLEAGRPLSPSIPAALRVALLRGLDTNPDGRPQTIEHWLAQVEAGLGPPAAAVPPAGPGAQRTDGRSGGTRRWAIIGAAAVVAIGGVGLAIATSGDDARVGATASSTSASAVSSTSELTSTTAATTTSPSTTAPSGGPATSVAGSARTTVGPTTPVAGQPFTVTLTGPTELALGVQAVWAVDAPGAVSGTWSLTGPVQPNPATWSPGNYFAGTWNVPGTFDLTLTAVDANGTTATQTLVFTVK